MSNEYYAPGDKRAERVHDLFDTIARRYDLINDLQSFGMHRRWKRRVVELAQVRAGDKALDVCCGTGDIALALAEQGAEVVGLDFSEQMLTRARVKGEVRRASRQKPEVRSLKSETKIEDRTGNPESSIQHPVSSIRFMQGDAMKIPFPDASFDVVTVGYGLRNLSSWEAGLREMARVSKPGGRIVILEFGKPDNAFWRSLYFGYLKLAVPMMGLLFCGNMAAYSYILESLKHYPGQQGVASKMREMGLKDVRVMNVLGGAMSVGSAHLPI